MDSSEPNHINTFFSQFPVVTLQKNQIIIHPASTITDIYLLRTGKVRMYAVSPDGEEITLHIFRPTSFFPIMLLLSRVQNLYYFESLEQSTAIQAPAISVIHFLKNEPDALFDLTERFSDAICGLLNRIEYLAFENAFNKIVRLLLYLSEKFGKKDGNVTVIHMEFSHEDIAHWIGLRRETVSRQIEKLQKRNLIHVRNKRITILDITMLQTLTTQ